ncbi:MAG: hypothetical protein KDD82_30440 [Planctomycetes bacterium]|nr:hypothetical protein [Planctomycetota bacterium]
MTSTPFPTTTLATPLAALICLLCACSGGYVPKPARTVNTWSPSPVGSSATAARSSAEWLDPRRTRENLALYHQERIDAREDDATHPLRQVGVGFPTRNWVTGYFLPDGTYVPGVEWVRGESPVQSE